MLKLLLMVTFKFKVIPNSQHNRLVQEPGRLKVYLNAPAVEGKANKALIEFLADHFKVKKSMISIKSGLTSREKIVEIRE